MSDKMTHVFASGGFGNGGAVGGLDRHGGDEWQGLYKQQSGSFG